jgi:signal transduction histidine kinase
MRIALVVSSILLISIAHYSTDTHLHLYHAVYRRLYYLPIFAAALWFGLRGGLGASLSVSVLYAPHILYQWKILPSMELEKYLEIVLFNVVGVLTGLLAQRANRQRDLYRRTSEKLEEAYQDLQERSSQLLRLEKRLRQQETTSALGELSATIAHEFMNPLGSIKGAVEILKDDFPEKHEKHGFLEILIKEIERLDRTVRSVLRFRRQERLAKSVCDPNALLDTILVLAQGEANQRGVEVTRQLAEDKKDLPLDADKIQQLFLNIVMNAIQAMPNGGRLTVTSQWTDGPPPAGVQNESKQGVGGVLFRFEDTGPGIPKDAMASLFDTFYTTKEEGTGLGLVIAKRIVDAHGGTIRVESEPGAGTCFEVWLPGSDGEETR